MYMTVNEKNHEREEDLMGEENKPNQKDKQPSFGEQNRGILAAISKNLERTLGKK